MEGYADYLIRLDNELYDEFEAAALNESDDLELEDSEEDDFDFDLEDSDWENEEEIGTTGLDIDLPDYDEPYDLEDFDDLPDDSTPSKTELNMLALAGLNESDLIDDLFEHRGKPGMKLDKKAYNGSHGKRAKVARTLRNHHETKAMKSKNLVSKTYHKVAARFSKANQSKNANHGKKDYIPGYRTMKAYKTLLTGRY
jgi:hypothetical protein|nr:MAG TPA: hypothetical protein [Caudoviricetes sp.]